MKGPRYKLKDVGAYNFHKITIPQSFSDNPPKPGKIVEKMLNFFRTSELEDIIVDESYCLIDGYCSYLIAEVVTPAYVKIKMIVMSKRRRIGKDGK